MKDNKFIYKYFCIVTTYWLVPVTLYKEREVIRIYIMEYYLVEHLTLISEREGQ